MGGGGLYCPFHKLQHLVGWLTDMTLGEDNNSWRWVLLADAVLSVGHWCLTAIYSKLLAFVVMRLAFSVT